MTAAEFRRLALAVPGAVEGAHMNHPDFRLDGRIFASLGAPDAAWGMVKLAPGQQAEFMEQAPGAFQPCAGAWGRSGYTNVRLAAARVPTVRQALALAAESTAVAKQKRRRTAPSRGRMKRRGKG